MGIRAAGRALACLAVTILGSGGEPVWAISGWAVEAGHGAVASTGAVLLQWDWSQRWFVKDDRHLGGYWELEVGGWRSDPTSSPNPNIGEIGLTPVFRWQRNKLEGSYIEFGVGLHVLSGTRIGNQELSTAFQFGDHIGIGYRFGAAESYDIGYRYQHLSNGGVKRPNDGINFHEIRLQYHF